MTAMEICKSDIREAIRLLDASAVLIRKYNGKPCERDKARRCMNLSRKLNRKLETFKTH